MGRWRSPRRPFLLNRLGCGERFHSDSVGRRSVGWGRDRHEEGRARQGVRLSSKSDSVTHTISDIEPVTRRPVLLVLAGIGLFVTALDAYVVVTLLPAMFADVGLTIDRFQQATPIVTGFLGGYVVAMRSEERRVGKECRSR